MTVIDDIANVIRMGGCVVMGVGVAPEKYRSLLEGATEQDYLVIGAKMTGELPAPKPLSVLGLKMKVYFIQGESVTN